MGKVSILLSSIRSQKEKKMVKDKAEEGRRKKPRFDFQLPLGKSSSSSHAQEMDAKTMRDGTFETI